VAASSLVSPSSPESAPFMRPGSMPSA
jgi:hypothetical protein